MTRTEHDLRNAFRQLEQRADAHGAPSIADILAATTEDRAEHRRHVTRRRAARWLPPLAAAALIAATAVTAVALRTDHTGASHPRAPLAGGQSTAGYPTAQHTATSTHHRSTPTGTPAAATILDDAAAKLDAAAWTAPAPQDFFYVRSTEATTWTSVSGTRAGSGRTTDGSTVLVPGCDHGQIVSTGQSGPCTLNDVPHYLGDAPTAPPAWDAYLERLAPGSKAAHAQGKIIVEVLHQDLVAPKAAAALLRYTANCAGLRTFTVRPVDGEKLIGVTCTSMINGSYGLAFDGDSHALAGFVVLSGDGRQDGPAELVRKTGIVPAIGRTP